MTLPSRLPNYVIVTPVRDESPHIGATLESVLAQTHPPLRWIVVDDGSTDDTLQIVQRQVHSVPWVSVVGTGSGERRLGSAEVLAFRRGLAELGPASAHDFIVKLDGDVRLPADYFERLLERMGADPQWGIGSGVYCENRRMRPGGASDDWQIVRMPAYHAAGASKVVRRQCFEQIGGFVAEKGWDTVDEIRAGLRGWRTGHCEDIVFEHMKPEGMAMGSLRTHRFHGDIYYQTGGGAMFLLAKVAHRMVSASPPVLGGLAMLWGYVAPLLTRRPRLVNDEEARYYRAMLNRRLAAPVTRLLAHVRS